MIREAATARQVEAVEGVGEAEEDERVEAKEWKKRKDSRVETGVGEKVRTWGRESQGLGGRQSTLRLPHGINVKQFSSKYQNEREKYL